MDGKAVSHAVYNWHVPELTELQKFFSVSPKEVAALAGYYLPDDKENEDDDESLLTLAPADFRPPPEVWFQPKVGLNAIRKAVLILRSSSPDAFVRPTTKENWLEFI